MATERLYLPSSGTAPVAPSTWNHANLAGTTYTMPGMRSHERSGTALTSRTTAAGTGVSGLRVGVMRYVWGPLAAVQITGTVSTAMRCSESSGSANANFSMAVKLIQPGGTDRSVLLAATSSDSNSTPYELTTTLSVKRVYTSAEAYPVTLTNQTPTAGDYLVVELGFRYGSVTSYNIVMAHGDPMGTVDCVDTVGDTNAYIPWLEFSNNLPWLEYPLPDVNMARMVG